MKWLELVEKSESELEGYGNGTKANLGGCRSSALPLTRMFDVAER